jgi:gamma-glutamyl hydrolase
MQRSHGTMLLSVMALMMTVGGTFAFPKQPANPIMAIVTTPLSDCYGISPPPSGIDIYGGCIESYYVRWLEASGIRVVPLIWNASWTERKAVLDSVNGALFPGGGLGGDAFTEYVGNATQIFNYATERNALGDAFFLWGTCQGFQVLGVIALQDPSVLKCIYRGTDPSMLPLDFTSYQPESTMFGQRAESPVNIVGILQNQNSTLNWHSCGINPSDLNANFNNIFKVISTNVDLNGLPFISAYESTTNNFFATQFHPERILYEFSDDIIGHTPDDILVSHYLSMFIAARLKLNNHSYPTANDANDATVENFPVYNLGWGSELYWIRGN